MTRFRGSVLALICCIGTGLAPTHGTAQSNSSVGQTLMPTGRIVMYSAPENGLITKQQANKLVAPSNGAITVYPLQRDGGDYITGAPSTSSGLTVESVRKVVQGKTTHTWLRVNDGQTSGWIRYDPAITGTLPNLSQ